MRRYQSRSGAHNLAIAARLAARDALPGTTMLAAPTGCVGRRPWKLARLRRTQAVRAHFVGCISDAQRGTKGNIKPKKLQFDLKPVRLFSLNLKCRTASFVKPREENSYFSAICAIIS